MNGGEETTTEAPGERDEQSSTKAGAWRTEREGEFEDKRWIDIQVEILSKALPPAFL